MATLTATEGAKERRLSSTSRHRSSDLRRLSSGDAAVPSLTPFDGKTSLRLNSSSKSINVVDAASHPSERSHRSNALQDGIPMDTFTPNDHTRDRSSKDASISMGPEANGDSTSASGFNMSVKNERMYLATLCFSLFVAGWNDATLGPLLPRIQEAYSVSYTVVSILFVSGCVGMILGATSNVYLTDRLGFGRLITAAAAAQMVTYAIMAPAPPFAVLCVAYCLNGFALSLQDAQANAFIASIPRNGSVNMGVLHAAYGLGAFASPLIATQFAQAKHWSFHFLVSVGIAFANAALLLYVFRLKRQGHFISEAGHADHPSAQGNKYKQIFSQKSVHFMAFFILVYVGVEVTIGGWIFTYLLTERGGGPSSGYVSSGFFGGLTLGRVILLPINAKIGNERVIYIYSALCIALEFTIWFVPNLIGNAVAVSIVGLLLGPFYPIAMNVISALLPPWILAGSIGYIAAFGQAGAAVFPFMTGALASKHGVKVLQPLIVAMMAVQMLLWFFVTHSKITRD